LNHLILPMGQIVSFFLKVIYFLHFSIVKGNSWPSTSNYDLLTTLSS
jgi:hypothetical protein